MDGETSCPGCGGCMCRDCIAERLGRNADGLIPDCGKCMSG